MTAKERKKLKAATATLFSKNWRQGIGGKASLFRRRKRKNKQPKNEQKEVLERRMIASESDSSLMKKVTFLSKPSKQSEAERIMNL